MKPGIILECLDLGHDEEGQNDCMTVTDHSKVSPSVGFHFLLLYNARPLLGSPGGLVVEIQRSHCPGLGSLPIREAHHLSVGCYTVAAACCCDAESYATGISNKAESPRVDRFQWSLQTRKEDLATHFRKMWP